MNTALWPSSWKARIRCSGIPRPMWMSGEVTSIPSFTRSGRPSFSFSSRAPCGRTSTALRVSSAIGTELILEAPRQEWRAGEPVAPRLLGRAGDPDPRPDRERRLALAGEELERQLVERQAVVDTRDAERLAELPGAGAEGPRRLEPAAFAHPVETLRRLERAHERRLRAAFRSADEIEAPVDAVRAVDVGATGRTEHRRRARGAAAEPVARGVVLVVRLDLDHSPTHAFEEQRRSDQLGRDLVHRAREEVAREPPVSHSRGLRKAARTRPAWRSFRARVALGGRDRAGRAAPRLPPSRRVPPGRARRPVQLWRPPSPAPCRGGSSARCGLPGSDR